MLARTFAAAALRATPFLGCIAPDQVAHQATVLRAPKGVSNGSQLPTTVAYRIDPSRDHLIALARLAEWYEGRTGRRLHRTVPYAWSQRGIHGIKLPVLRLGGVRYSSEEAIAWWAEMLASADPSESGANRTPPSHPVETEARRATDGS